MFVVFNTHNLSLLIEAENPQKAARLLTGFHCKNKRHTSSSDFQSFFFEVKSSPLVKRKAGNVSAKFRTTETATTTITATRATTTYDGAHPLCVDENH